MSKFRAKYVKDYFLQSKVRQAVFWIIEIIVVVAAAFFIAFFFCQNVVVSESSMEPTLAVGDKVLINSMAYSFSSPKRGDIIVFKDSDETGSNLHIKRIVGLPGEKIQIKEGQIYINDELYVEGKDFPSITNPGLAEEPIVLGGTEYFVLGDNRNNSEDSRHSDIGTVKKSEIVGKLWLVSSPFSKFGFLKS